MALAALTAHRVGSFRQEQTRSPARRLCLATQGTDVVAGFIHSDADGKAFHGGTSVGKQRSEAITCACQGNKSAAGQVGNSPLWTKSRVPSRKRTETPFFEEAAQEAAWEIGPGIDNAGQVVRKRPPRRRGRLE